MVWKESVSRFGVRSQPGAQCSGRPAVDSRYRTFARDASGDGIALTALDLRSAHGHLPRACGRLLIARACANHGVRRFDLLDLPRRRDAVSFSPQPKVTVEFWRL